MSDTATTHLNAARDWKARANCLGVDPALFFPERGEAHDVAREAREVCDGCTVTVECLEYALEIGETLGIWGGKSERERRKLRRARSRATRDAAVGSLTPLAAVTFDETGEDEHDAPEAL